MSDPYLEMLARQGNPHAKELLRLMRPSRLEVAIWLMWRLGLICVGAAIIFIAWKM